MIKRQQRIARIAAVLEEYFAARTASDLLTERTDANPGYGLEHGWKAAAGKAFADNLATTYIVRIFAEFEAALRDYWATYRKKKTQPRTFELVNRAIPGPSFSRDIVDDADAVREFRNRLVHDLEDEPGNGGGAFTVQEAKSRLCAYLGRLDPAWR